MAIIVLTVFVVFGAPFAVVGVLLASNWRGMADDYASGVASTKLRKGPNLAWAFMLRPSARYVRIIGVGLTAVGFAAAGIGIIAALTIH